MSDTTTKDVPKTFLGTLLKRRANKMGLAFETEDGEEGGVQFTRHDVIGDRNRESWFYFSIILVHSDHSVGVWTREMMSKGQGPLEAERTYVFSSDTFDKWLDGFFEDAVLEELTKP